MQKVYSILIGIKAEDLHTGTLIFLDLQKLYIKYLGRNAETDSLL